MSAASDNSVMRATTLVARMGRWGTAEQVREARQILAETKLRRAVREALEADPPLREPVLRAAQEFNAFLMREARL